MKRVYQFGCRVLTGLDVIDAQMVAAHRYGNELIAIERGRRHVLRQVDDTLDVRNAIETVKAATKSTRKAAISALRVARKAARDAAPEELARIGMLDAAIRKDARALTDAYWGNYLTIEASAMQQRQMPLYEEDGHTPSDPRFMRWDGDAQVGIQIQGGLATSEVTACNDTRVRLHLGTAHRRWRESVLWLRVGSEGRNPVWATIGMRMDRAIPDDATWKWVRLSRRRSGPIDRASLVSRRKPSPLERWTVEITVETSSLASTCPRELDTLLTGAIAIEPTWEETDGGLRVAYWRDSRGESGEIVLPASDARLAKSNAMRSGRDIIANAMRELLHRELVESREALPRWLVDARNTMHLWRALGRFHALARRWADEASAVATKARRILDQWAKRDDHLWRYEAGVRTGALRARRELYRVTAAEWSRRYRTVLVPKRDYSRIAQFGADADLRHRAAPSEFVTALEGAFSRGCDALVAPWATPDADAPSWTEATIERWNGGDPMLTARATRTALESQAKGGAWARRKEAKRLKESSAEGSARKPHENAAE